MFIQQTRAGPLTPSLGRRPARSPALRPSAPLLTLGTAHSPSEAR